MNQTFIFPRVSEKTDADSDGQVELGDFPQDETEITFKAKRINSRLRKNDKN